ncbi:hypothetical protein [uncultured Roseibium sp.]|uniref:hypothetical protein n=1 Tax=uncultured Roseibium sp. TaxID=1936171 RepID=UPI003455CE58
MHYTIIPDKRINVYFTIAVISGILVEISAVLIGMMRVSEFIIFYYDIRIPSAFVVFTAILKIYDEYLWKLPPFKWQHGIPNLNEENYNAIVIQGNGERTDHFDCSIKQTFTKIQIQITLSKSISRVTTASLDFSSPGNEILKYSYEHLSLVQDSKHYLRGDGFQTLVKVKCRWKGSSFSTWNRSTTVILEPRKSTRTRSPTHKPSSRCGLKRVL